MTGTGESEALRVPKLAADRAQGFVGRRATIGRIADWLETSDPYLCLTGDPGTGKSALMAWLAGAGQDPTDGILAKRRSGILKALDHVHFCVATSPNDPTLDPWLFSRDLGRRLAVRDPRFGSFLTASLGPSVTIIMEAKTVGKQVGPQIGEINIADAASLFNVVTQSLRDAAVAEPGRSFVVAIDSLDEAELWPKQPRIGDLGMARLSPEAPSNLRFLLSCRPTASILDRLPEEARWDIVRDAPGDVADVGDYVQRRLIENAPGADPRLAERITNASQGNFLYAEHALDYWLPRIVELAGVDELDLPPGLDAIYGLFLQREYGTPEGRERWKTDIRPLLATIGVAREPLSRGLLAWLLDVDDERLSDRLRAARQYLTGDLPDGPFAIYHQSFREFLFDPKRNAAFSVSEATAHARIGRRFVDAYHDAWEAVHDDYGLRHTVTHLAEASRQSAQPGRHELATLTASTAVSASFQAAYEAELGDPIALVADVARALETVAQDDDPRSAGAVTRTALALTAVRRRALRPESVFEAAGRGDLVAAERRLASFSIEDHWRQAAQLACAWLAVNADRASAIDLLHRVRSSLLSYFPLAKLAERVAVDLEGAPMPDLPALDHPPEYVARSIVDRLGGTNLATAPSVLSEYAPAGEDILEGWLHASESAWGAGADYAPILAAEVEAPLLVGFAADAPEPGDRYFDQYVTLHAANDYVHYRNRSLWSILGHAAHHPDQAWVRQRLGAIVGGAMAGSRLDFVESLPLTVLALDPGANQGSQADFDAAVDDARQRAGTLIPGSDREGDAWGEHKRRLGALSEAASRILDREPTAKQLIDQAVWLPFGFAGFQAPACLTLAETISVCRPGDTEVMGQVLQQASAASHNVQDPLLCARVTARVNAMVRRWWPGLADHGTVDPAAVIERLVGEPESAEFGAVHVVGESYANRDPGPGSVPLPGSMRDAATLRDIARVHERPLSELQRLNESAGWGPDDPLDQGLEVAIPDPDFTALLAARLSALALTAPGLTPRERTRIVEQLVPIAATNVTALDTTLARLLIAARPADIGTWDLAPFLVAPPGDERAWRHGSIVIGQDSGAIGGAAGIVIGRGPDDLGGP